MSRRDRLADAPVLNWAIELGAVLVLLGAGAVAADAIRSRALSDLPPCVAPRAIPAGALSDNPLRYP